MPSTAFDSLVAMLRANPIAPGTPLAEVRDRFERIVPLLGRAPESVSVAPATLANLAAERYMPAGASPGAAVLFLHGGGYCIGSLNTHRAFAARLAETSGVPVVSIDYRLAPEHPFPAAVDDAMAAYRALLREGVPPARIAIAGDSAGGGLTLAVIAALRDSGDPLPGAGICLSPWTDLANTGASIEAKAPDDPILQPWELHEYAQRYLNGSDARNSLASPLYGSFKGFPPLLIHVGGAEILLDDSTRTARSAADAGVDVTFKLEPEMIHVWHFFAGVIPEGAAALQEVGDYIKSRISGTS